MLQLHIQSYALDLWNPLFIWLYPLGFLLYFIWKIRGNRKFQLNDPSIRGLEVVLDYVEHNPQFYFELESHQIRLGNESAAKLLALRSHREEMFKRANWSLGNFGRWTLHNFTGHGARISPLVAIWLILLFWATVHFASPDSVKKSNDAIASEASVALYNLDSNSSTSLSVPLGFGIYRTIEDTPDHHRPGQLAVNAVSDRESIKSQKDWSLVKGFAIVMRHSIPFATFVDQNDWEPSDEPIGYYGEIKRMSYAQVANLLTISGWILIPVFISSGLRNLRLLDRRRFTENH